MQAVTGAWLALAGVLAVMSGIASMRRARQLRRRGTTAWAVIVRSSGPGEHQDAGSRRMLVQFALPDGRVVERTCPEPTRGPGPRSGQQVLVWYDPEDPADVLVSGRQSRRADKIFVAVGTLFMIVGSLIAFFGH